MEIDGIPKSMLPDDVSDEDKDRLEAYLVQVKRTREQLAQAGVAIETMVRHILDRRCECDMLVFHAAKLHRTEQQALTNFAFAWLVHLSSLGPGQMDGRNERAVTLAKSIRRAVPEIEWKLPYV